MTLKKNFISRKKMKDHTSQNIKIKTDILANK